MVHTSALCTLADMLISWCGEARCQSSAFRVRPREGLAVQRQPEEAGEWQLSVHSEEAGACQRQDTIVGYGGGRQKRGKTTIGALFPEPGLSGNKTPPNMSSGGRCKLLSPLWAPEMGTGHSHNQGPMSRHQLLSLGVGRLSLLLRDTGASANCQPCCPGTSWTTAAPGRRS